MVIFEITLLFCTNRRNFEVAEGVEMQSVSQVCRFVSPAN